jgi:hypothetical protein
MIILTAEKRIDFSNGTAQQINGREGETATLLKTVSFYS